MDRSPERRHIFAGSKLIMYSFLKSFLLSQLALSSPAPCNDTYIIQIPNSINVTEQGSINVNIVENNLGQNQTLYIEFDDEFTISDSHGKEDLSGYTTGYSISIEADDTSSRTVNYYLPEIPVGEWSGYLGLSIRLDTVVLSNMLQSGSDLNQINSSYRPNYVEFSNNTVNSYDDAYDVSLAQDGSVMLYEVNGDTIIISNHENVPILANYDMSEMFKNVTSLTEIRNIDLLDLSYCSSISGMFNGANHLTSIGGINDLSTDTINDMSYLFANTQSLRNIDLNCWDTDNVVDMSFMFNNSAISNLSSIEEWTTSNVQDMNSMFYQERGVSSLNLSSWDVSEVKDMGSMFSSLRNLTTINLNGWDTAACENMSGLFQSSQKLTGISGLGSLETENVEDMSYMFYGCNRLSNIEDLSGWDTGNVNNMAFMFSGLQVSSIGDISCWDVGSVISFESMFNSCQAFTCFPNPGDWDVSDKCTNLSMMFYNTRDILPSDLDLTGWDVSNVTSTAAMFYGCHSLEYLDITGWDTGNLEDASGMFEYNTLIDYSALTDIIGIEEIDTSNLSNISRMFKLNRFVNVDLSGWDTSSLEDISQAFNGCYRQDLDKLKHWNVSSVTDMTDCFADDAGSLSGSDIPDWYVS